MEKPDSGLLDPPLKKRDCASYLFNFMPTRVKVTHIIHNFAYQAIVGLKYVICKGWETSLDYRFCEIGKHHSQHKVGLTLTRYF